MKTPRPQIAGIIADRTLSATFTTRDVTSLAAYLLEDRRTSELDSLLRDVRAAWADRGYVEVTATSAFALSAQTIREITAEARRVYPDAKRVAVTQKLDPGLVGGLRLQIVDHQLDASVAGELQKFKTSAMQGKDQIR